MIRDRKHRTAAFGEVGVTNTGNGARGPGMGGRGPGAGGRGPGAGGPATIFK